MSTFFHLVTVLCLLCSQTLFAFSRIEDYPAVVGARTISQTNAQTGLPLYIELFYPTIEGLPATKMEGLWDLPPVVCNGPILESGENYPLVVISHGENGNRFSLAWLASILADQGCIVAAVDHYGASWPQNEPYLAVQRWLRPSDISQTISILLKDPVLASAINKDRIAVLGFSTGALNALWLAGGVADHYDKPSRDRSDPFITNYGLKPEMLDTLPFHYAKSSYYDDRIKAAIILSPTFGKAFDRDGLRDIKIPVLVIASEGDSLAPVNDNANFFGRWIQRSVLKVLPGRADHYVFLNLPSLTGKQMLKHQWVTDNEGVDRKQIHLDTAGEIVDFLVISFK